VACQKSVPQFPRVQKTYHKYEWVFANHALKSSPLALSRNITYPIYIQSICQVFIHNRFSGILVGRKELGWQMENNTNVFSHTFIALHMY
jgi:hypothetical protein